MGAHRGHPLLLALLLIVLVVTHGVHADTNVTVDDTDTTAIIYSPPTSWVETSFDPLDAGGTHMLTDDPDATATFTFTGTAIYFWAPLWPSDVTTALSLDGAPPKTISLRDNTQPEDMESGPTVKSQPVWSFVGLDDTVHTLVISVGAGENLAIVDELQYTTTDADPTLPTTSTDTDTLLPTPTIESTSSLSSSTLSLLPTPTQSAVSSSTSSTPPGLSIAIGIVVALFAILALGGLFWWWRRRVRRRREREAYAARDANAPPEMGESGNSATMGGALGRTRSARYRDIAAYFGGAAPAAASAASTSSGRRGSSGRRSAPPPPHRKKSKPLGTIPEVHPRDVLVEEEEQQDGALPSAGAPEWANVRLVDSQRPRSSSGPGHDAVVSDAREDPWTIRGS